MKRQVVFSSLLAIGTCAFSLMCYCGLASLSEAIEASATKIIQQTSQNNAKEIQSSTIKPSPQITHLNKKALMAAAIKKIMPKYPPACRCSGTVQILIVINEEGLVIDAEAIIGHPLMRESAIEAAKQWTFKPIETSSIPVKRRGVLSFNFTSYGHVFGDADSTKGKTSANSQSETSLSEVRNLTVWNAPLLAGAIKRVMPVYSSHLRANGLVKVRIAFDINGEVQEAEALTGHPLLRQLAVDAARQWRFKATEITAPPIMIHGVLAFRFAIDKNGEQTVTAERVPVLPRLQQVLVKLHPSISVLIERLITNTETTANEATFVRKGKAELLIRLVKKNNTAIAELEKLGFEINKTPKESELISGRLLIEKLESLAKLEIVRFISPMTEFERK